MKCRPTASEPVRFRSLCLVRPVAGAALITCLTAATAVAQSSSASSDPKIDDEVVQLSPFLVEGELDRGYQAAGTTAGSRLAIPMKETSAMIGMITRDFIDDIAAVDIAEIGSWGANVYFTGAEDSALQQQQLPNAIIRGIPGSFQSLARNYFITYTNVFPYNVERIEIPRGPNAALYGDAPLGGIVNSNTKRAKLSRNIKQISIRTDSEGSLQTSLDVNVPAGKKVAVRVNAMWENREGWRDADFQRNRAIHLAGTWNIFKHTTFRGEYEYGITKKSLPPSSFTDQVANWDGTTVYTAPRTSNFGTATGTTGLANSTDYLLFDSGAPELGLTNWRGYGRTTGSGLGLLSEEDYDVDYRPGLSRFPVIGDRKFSFNPKDMTWSQREASMLAGYLEHVFFNKLAVELAYNYQTPVVKRTLGLFNTVSQDINRVRPDGTPNPHFGDLYADIEYNNDKISNWVNDGRIMATYPVKWRFMEQRIVGLYGQRRDYYNQYRESLTRVNGTDQRIRNANNIVRVRRYVEDGYIPFGTPVDSNGYDIEWLGYRMTKEMKHTTYSQIGMSGRYWGGKVATTVGWRHDNFSQDVTDAAVAESALTIGSAPGYVWRSQDPVRNASPDSWQRYPNRFEVDSYTAGIVYFPVKWAGVFANYSEGFTVQGAGAHMDGSPWNPPTNSGTDIGIKVEFFDGKVSGTVSRYQSERTGVDQGLTSRANAFKEIWNFIEAGYNSEATAAANAGNATLAAELTALANEKGAIGDAITPGAYDTRNTKANGWELDLVFNPTRNWRGTVNFSMSDAFVSGAYSDTRAYYDKYVAEWRARAANSAVTDSNAINTRLTTIETGFYNNTDGRTLDRTPDYSARLFTTYRFTKGALNKLMLGGGMQLDGARVIGAPQEWNPATNAFITPDPLGSVKSESYYLANVMASYEFKLWGQRIKTQLNINNLLDEDKLLFTGVGTYTRADGGVTTGYFAPTGNRYITPRTFVLSATVNF
jgi:outer membrane receptor protein involved in Fe transport